MQGRAFSTTFEWQLLSHFVVRSPGFPFSLLRDFRCDETARAIETMAGRSDKSIASAQGLRALFETEAERGRAALERVVRTEAFQEAIFLSSPDLYENNVGKYLRAVEAGRTNSDTRRIERRLFAYLQRFVAKNETTSIFGPLNYGVVDRAARAPVTLRYVDGNIVQRRRVLLSFWAVKAIAEAIARDERLAPDLPLRLAPWVEIVRPGRLALHHQSGKEVGLPLAFTTLLARLESAQTLAALDAPPSFIDAVPRLLQAGILERSLEVPSTELELLEHLEGFLDALPASVAKDEWQTQIRAWKTFCSDFARASLNERRALLASAEVAFTTQTGLAPRRGSGEMYADRFIFYEEALGNVARFAFNEDVHERLTRKLRGALELAAAQGEHQWRALREEGARLHAELSPNGEGIPFASFIAEVQKRIPKLPDVAPPPFARKLEEQVANSDARVVDVPSAALAIPEVERELYSLPDVFLSSASEQAMQAGRFDVFLGKLHHHLLVPGWLTTHHAEEGALRAELAEVLADGSFARLAALEVKRRNKGFYDFPGPRIEYAERTKRGHPHRRFALHDLVVARTEHGEIALFDREGREIFLYLTLADHLHYAPFAMFALPWLAPTPIRRGSHTPRIAIDGVVIQRERWTIASTEVLSLKRKDPLESFIALQRLQKEKGLPNRVYVKGSERKPVFVDFAIPHCHALLLSLAESASSLDLEEMYPGPDDLWLNQSFGGFTCELRMNVLKRKTRPMSEAREAAE